MPPGDSAATSAGGGDGFLRTTGAHPSRPKRLRVHVSQTARVKKDIPEKRMVLLRLLPLLNSVRRTYSFCGNACTRCRPSEPNQPHQHQKQNGRCVEDIVGR